MADPTVVDVFKFVAVRPAQKSTVQDADKPFLRDARAENPDRQRDLAETGRAVSSREAALRHWEKLDLSRLQELAAILPRLQEKYRTMSPVDDPPDVGALLEGFGVRIDAADHQQLTESAWDAFYIASATGPDAGSRLETPLAALRVLHLTTLGAKPGAQAALAAQAIKPLIPQIIFDFRQSPRERPNAEPNRAANATPQAPSEESRSMLALLDELHTARNARCGAACAGPGAA